MIKLGTFEINHSKVHNFFLVKVFLTKLLDLRVFSFNVSYIESL